MAATNNGGKAGKQRVKSDPERRTRIAEAAVTVVAEVGVDGLTHRAVAAVAGVPLGSTTYYFDTLDDLLAAAMEIAAGDNVRELGEWAAQLGPDSDLPGALADLVLRSGGPDRDRLVVGYELYFAALRRPALQPLSQRWSQVLIELLTPHTDPLTASGLAATIDGFQIRMLVSGETPLDRAEVEQAFQRLLKTSQRDRS